MPGAHDRQVVEPANALEYVPLAQYVHASASKCETALPCSLLYFPAIHAVHTSSIPYVYCESVYPALQRHSLCVLHPTHVAPEFAGHAVQVALPSTSLSFLTLYVPAEQFAHGPPHGPLVPAGQTTHVGVVVFGVGVVVVGLGVVVVGVGVVVVGVVVVGLGVVVVGVGVVVVSDAFKKCPGLHVHALASPQPTHDAPEFAGHGTHADSSLAPMLVEYVRAPHAEHAPEPVVFFHVPAAQALHAPAERVYPAPHCVKHAFVAVSEVVSGGQSLHEVAPISS